MRYFLLFCLIVLMVSCTSMTSMKSERDAPQPASAPPSAAKAYPKPAPMPMPIPQSESGSAGSDSYVLMVRSFLYPNNSISNVRLNLIFFPKRPVTVEEKIQYLSLCETWKSSFPMTEEVAEQIKGDEDVVLLPMYWLSAKVNRNYSCDTLVKNYDYSRAQILAGRWKFDSTKVQLISRVKGKIIMMDLSTLKQSEDLLLAMNVWRTKMCPVPKRVSATYAIDLLASAKRTLGALGNLLTMK